MNGQATFCIQCSMKALIEKRAPEVFDETPAEHAKRVHPDPVVTQRERLALEQQLAALIAEGKL